MRNYPNKQALLDAVQTALDKYLAEFADIPESARNIRAADGGKTPSEHLSYQLGWVSSLLDWERREQAGEEVHTPAEGFKWNNLGGLYQRFYQVYSVYTLAEQQAMLRGKTAELCAWIKSLSEDELFLIGQRKWRKLPRNGRCGSGYISTPSLRLPISVLRFGSGKGRWGIGRMSNFLEKFPLLVLAKLVLLVFRVRSLLAGRPFAVLEQVRAFPGRASAKPRIAKKQT